MSKYRPNGSLLSKQNENDLKRVPSPRDQTQSHPHRDLDECQQGSCHPPVHLRMVTFCSQHSEPYHMRNTRPNPLFTIDKTSASWVWRYRAVKIQVRDQMNSLTAKSIRKFINKLRLPPLRDASGNHHRILNNLLNHTAGHMVHYRNLILFGDNFHGWLSSNHAVSSLKQTIQLQINKTYSKNKRPTNITPSKQALTTVQPREPGSTDS